MIPSTLATAGLVARKELRDLSRDPRTLFLSFALPLFLFPALFWMLAAWTPGAEDGGRPFRIALGAPWHGPQADASRFVFVPLDEGEDYDALWTVGAPDGGAALGTIVYDNKRPRSIAAYRALAALLGEDRRAADYGSVPLHPEEEAAGDLILGLLVPLMLLLFAVSCPLPVAADVSSGEKERGSLEALLATSAPRTGIVLGKLGAVAAAGSAGAAAYALGVYLSYRISPSILGPGPYVFARSPGELLLLGLFGLLITALFSALELAAGTFTRSVREAQLLGMPLLILSMGAVYAAQSVDLREVPAFLPHVPLVNLSLAVRELAQGDLRVGHLIPALCWGILYLAGAAFLSARLFRRESMVLKR